MDKNKFDQVVHYFDSMSISIPTAVKNAIQDVFEENDNIANVDCYHAEDIIDFEKDITATNTIDMLLGVADTQGPHHGSVDNMYTYYGDINRALHESILLKDADGETLEEISGFSSGEYSLLNNPADWAVIVVEKVEWDSKDNSFSRTARLIIYCPINDEDEEDAKFRDVYNTVKAEEGDIQ